MFADCRVVFVCFAILRIRDYDSCIPLLSNTNIRETYPCSLIYKNNLVKTIPDSV